jgi:hypothetical protein
VISQPRRVRLGVRSLLCGYFAWRRRRVEWAAPAMNVVPAEAWLGSHDPNEFGVSEYRAAHGAIVLQCALSDGGDL